MDAGTVVVLVLAAIIILAAIAIIAQALSAHRKSSAEAYSVRMRANADIVARMASRNDHAIDIDYAGVLTITPREMTSQPAEQAQNDQNVEPVTDDEIKAWKLALDLVTASVVANPDGNQLIAASAFGSGSGYETATALLKSRGWIMTVSGGRGAGAFVRDEIGTVKALLPKVALEGAIRSLPRRSSVVA